MPNCILHIFWTAWLVVESCRSSGKLKCPASSRDLSPNKTFGASWNQNITPKQLKSCIRGEWDNISLSNLQQPVHKMLSVVRGVIQHCGKHAPVSTFSKHVAGIKLKMRIHFPKNISFSFYHFWYVAFVLFSVKHGFDFHLITLCFYLHFMQHPKFWGNGVVYWCCISEYTVKDGFDHLQWTS